MMLPERPVSIWKKFRQLIDGQKKATQQDIYQLAQYFKISPAIIALGQIPERYELEKYVRDFRGKKGSKLSRSARALALHLYRTIDVYRSAFRTSRKEFVGHKINIKALLRLDRGALTLCMKSVMPSRTF